MEVNKYFDGVFLINLRRRPYRLKEATYELTKAGIKFNVFDAVDGNTFNDLTIPSEYRGNTKHLKPGAVGCLLSHISLIKYAKEKGLKNILIFEDDVVFSKNFNSFFNTIINEIPKDWDMFYLGGHPIQGQITKVSKNINKSSQILATHSYAINASAYDIILNSNEYKYAIDTLYTELIHMNINAYICNPRITYQREGYSDISNGNRAYKHLIDNN